MPRINVYLPDALFETFVSQGKREGIIREAPSKMSGISNYMQYILKYYFEHKDEMQSRTDPRIQEFQTLVKEQQEFLSNLDKILRTASQKGTVNSEHMIGQVIALLSHDKITFHEIHEITKIPESELLVLLGHLYSEGKIGYDEKWRYFKI